MKIKTIILTLALMCAGSITAQHMPERVPGELSKLPEVTFKASNAMRAQGATTANVVLDQPARSRDLVKQVPAADASQFTGRTLYGCLINSTLWGGYSITDVPYGIYSFEINSGNNPAAHITDMGYGFKAAAWGRDRHYGIIPLNVMGIINGARNITIDTKNWKEVKNTMWDTSYGTYSLIACAMAYDITDDTFYAFQYEEDLSGLNWVKVNVETDQFEPIAAYRGRTIVLALAATSGGEMYYIDGAGDLYTINKRNGRTSLVGNTGVTPTAYDQCMTYDGKTGTFLWAAQSTDGSVLYSVDPATAEAKQVMKFKNNEQWVSLYMTTSEAPAEAPAAVSRAQMKYAAPGSLESTITFTVPSKTFSGSTLTGNVNLNVWLDGENLKGEDVAPGTAMSIPNTLTEGNHYVCITTDNAAGFSPVRYIYQYAGYDTPLAPTEATLSVAGGNNSLTWKAPTAGINSGYIDAAALTYNVVRYPGAVTVATGISATSFSEPTPGDMQSYYYRVTAINGSHESAYAESNHVLCGDSFSIPYKQDFNDMSVFTDFFTVVDNDGDGNSWRKGYTNEVRIDYIKNGKDADDWLITPPIKMESGMKYRYHMNMKTFTPAYPENFEIYIGTDRTDLNSFRLIKSEKDFTEIASAFGDYTCDFFVDESKDYFMAVRYCSTLDMNSSLIMIKEVGVDAVGNALAPAQVENLTITPDANDELKARIAFTTPTLNLMGEDLTSIAAVSIYRNGDTEPLHTFTSITKGQEISWTDENVPNVGLHTYTVTAFNIEGKGEDKSMEKFIGVYTAPYSTNFDDEHYSTTLWKEESNISDDPNAWWGWKWENNENVGGTHFTLYYYLMENKKTDIWLFTPRFKLDENTVYTVNYDWRNNYASYPDMTWGLYMGEENTIEGMTNKLDNIPSTGNFVENREHFFVNNDAGTYYLGFGASGATQYDYFSALFDNFSLTRRTSAFAPYMMTNYKCNPSSDGSLKATMSFNAPTVNYKKQALDANEDLNITIYQGNSTIPVYTTTAKPGAKVTWTHEGALHGFNQYLITCENQYGRGEVIRDTLWVGRDKPEIVANATFRGTADNDNVTIKWSCPAKGVNGGVIVPAEVKYNVYGYDPSTDVLTPIAADLTETQYTVEANYTGVQKMAYYAVSAVNTEGEGQALASGIVLGKPYDLPFKESFANTTMSTQLWQMVPMVEQATAWGTTVPSPGYNECTGPQDNDGGCLYMYNGYQSEAYIGALLASPKIRLNPASGNELRFWTYNFQEKAYSNPAFVRIGISADDTEAVVIKDVPVGGRTEAGWTENIVSLDRYRTSNFISIVFLGITGGYQDVIYMDNISVDNTSISGIDNVTVDSETQHTGTFNLQGQQISEPTAPGIYIRDGKKVIINP